MSKSTANTGEFEEKDEDYGGYVASRGGSVSSGGTGRRSKAAPPSWASEGETSNKNFHDGMKSNASSPARFSRSDASSRKKKGTQTSKTASDSMSLPPEIPEQDSSFKGWLTSGILETLNVAAGVTMATTGQLMAPPLHMTKTVLLPGILALFVDTMDSITSPRVKSWLRIISASIHHLLTVLSSTEKGQVFSNHFLVVLQDFIQALSAPETRQVLVDGMACNVKLVSALHTPETQLFLEQLGILGCRLVDAAASGKSKQLFQDTIQLVWKGIETASDPATTLALAEVTAHLCHALEDAQQQSSHSGKRSKRNAQNQSTYLDSLRMSEFPQETSIEEIILSCLGQVPDYDSSDESDSVTSNVTWNDAQQQREVSHEEEVEKHRDKVDTELLRSRIFAGKTGQPSRGKTNTSAKTSAPNSSPDTEVKTVSSKPNSLKMQHQEGEKIPHDIEDLASDYNPQRNQRKSDHAPLPRAISYIQDKDENSAVQFYSMLDGMLSKNKSQQGHKGKDLQGSFYAEDCQTNSLKDFKAKMTKLNRKIDITKRTDTTKTSPFDFKTLPRRRRALILSCIGFFGLTSLVVTTFAIYGIYIFFGFKSTQPYEGKPQLNRHLQIRESSNSDIVIRVVREVVHVNAEGDVLSRAIPDSKLPTEKEITQLSECIASSFDATENK